MNVVNQSEWRELGYTISNVTVTLYIPAHIQQTEKAAAERDTFARLASCKVTWPRGIL